MTYGRVILVQSGDTRLSPGPTSKLEMLDVIVGSRMCLESLLSPYIVPREDTFVRWIQYEIVNY